VLFRSWTTTQNNEKLFTLIKMKSAIVFASILTQHVQAYSSNNVPGYVGKITEISSRRSALGNMIAAATGVLLPRHAEAGTVSADPELLTDVYFGVGCFWHIQHEFIGAERELLGRSDHQLSSRTGYAGGSKLDKEGRVCYHNFQNIADYGKMGHGEVVGMSIPEKSIVDFAKVYFSLFNPTTKDRVDPMDRGGEYRSLLGLPGGPGHPLYPGIEAAAIDAGFTLKAGKGNDPDTLGKQIVYVMDSKEFPFYQAEVYHQYHDDFLSPPYGRKYNSLVNLALEDGRVKGTGCPDRI